MPKSPKKASAAMDDMMTIAEAADAIGKSTRTIRRYIEDKVIPGFIAGKRGLVVRASDVAGLLKPYVCGATLPDPDATPQTDAPITVTLPASTWRKAERAMSERAYYLLGRAEVGGLDPERIAAIKADLDATVPLCDAIMTALYAADHAGKAA